MKIMDFLPDNIRKRRYHSFFENFNFSVDIFILIISYGLILNTFVSGIMFGEQ